MAEDLDVRVVLKQTVLQGSGHSGVLQRIATVYIAGKEYRVSAPPDARGDALDWLPHLTVRKLVDLNAEVEIRDNFAAIALAAVKKELEKQKRDSNRAVGMHPDDIHYEAEICLKGHVLHFSGVLYEPQAYCTKCGAPCIGECRYCEEPIRGAAVHSRVRSYSRPLYCHKCGKPYPWMEDRLKTARELLEHDEKLSLDDRTRLWEDLQYVMSDPKSDLAPAKKKLIELKLEKATKYVREFVLDLMAKTAAELIKG